jgi:hypothetical protein
MSVEHRLRAGLTREANRVVPRTEEQLAHVGRRHRRRRTIRWSGLAAAAAAATIVGVAVVPESLPGGESDAPPASVEESTLPGNYVVNVVPSRIAEREDMVGRWAVVLTRRGVMEIEPPAGYGRATSGAAYEVRGDVLTTNAFLDLPGCQTVTNGEYQWSLSGRSLELTVVDDPCSARRVLFSGQDWSRVR